MSSSSSPTRERILDEAMRLFAEEGFKGTSAAQVERASGLTPGAGGLFHHFRNKEAVLEAGLARQRDRLAALRAMRPLFADLGDLRAELTVIGRYVLHELGGEGQLLRIAASDRRRLPHLLSEAVDSLVGETFTEFGLWLRTRVRLSDERATRVAEVALGALVGRAVLAEVLGVPSEISDEDYVNTWVEMVLPRLQPTKG